MGIYLRHIIAKIIKVFMSACFNNWVVILNAASNAICIEIIIAKTEDMFNGVVQNQDNMINDSNWKKS